MPGKLLQYFKLNKPALGLALGLIMMAALLPGSAISGQDDILSDTVLPGISDKKPVNSKSWMLVTSHPTASKIGGDVIRAGGNAVDAMVAVQLVLGLVEPQSSGLGGASFLVYWNAKEQRLTSFDGRETAPQNARGDLFLAADGRPEQSYNKLVGARSVAVPGTLKLLESVHRKYGNLPWQRLFQPAIALAAKGFKVSTNLNAEISSASEYIYSHKATREYFLTEEAVPIYTGTILTNKDYQKTLRKIADGGSAEFYRGTLARTIVKRVQNDATVTGLLSLQDLDTYKVIERPPVCTPYRTFEICGPAPPSTGATTIGQILKLVEPDDLASLGPANPQSWRIIGEAGRLAYADEDRYLADADFGMVPWGLLDADYLEKRRNLLATRSPNVNSRKTNPGNPPAIDTRLFADDASLDLPSGSHVSIVDRQGNMVSMTSSLANAFGSYVKVGGFMLNNAMGDFSVPPERDGKPIANRIEGGKRPRSSMSPLILMKDGRPVATFGSAGNSRISAFLAKLIIARIDWRMDLQQALNLPHLVNRYGKYELESGTSAKALQLPLEAIGYDTVLREFISGMNGIEITPDGLSGATDPRGAGMVIGE